MQARIEAGAGKEAIRICTGQQLALCIEKISQVAEMRKIPEVSEVRRQD